MQTAPAPVLVIGPGAIGILVAARLAAAGTPVVLAARTPAAARELAAKGLRGIGPDGSVVMASPAVISSPRKLTATPSLVVLATKCAAAEPALRDWLPSLGRAPVVALQNGVLGDRLKRLAGDRLVECTVAFPATLLGPGESEQTGPGGFHVGAWPSGVSIHANVAAELLRPAGTVAVSTNMRGVKWSKLLINSCMTTLGVATGQPFGALMADRRARRAFLAIVKEGHAAGRADGVQFEPVSGFRAGLFASPLPGKDVILRVLGRKYRRHRSSSLQSLERGQTTEVDELNGAIVALARRHGLAAPVNEALVALVHDIEAGRTTPDLANLDRLA